MPTINRIQNLCKFSLVKFYEDLYICLFYTFKLINCFLLENLLKEIEEKKEKGLIENMSFSKRERGDVSG